MKIIRKISEDEVVVAFLRAEMESSRYGERIKQLLTQFGAGESVILRPDLSKYKDNLLRKEILGGYRGYPNQCLFAGLDLTSADWVLVELSKEDLASLHYPNFDEWVELGFHTRNIKHTAEYLLEGDQLLPENTSHVEGIRLSIRRGKELEPIICLNEVGSAKLHVLEGNSRATAFLLERDLVPDSLQVIVGRVNSLSNWEWK